MIEKINKICIGTFSSLGCLSIISGIALPNMFKFENNSVTKLEVTQRQVTNAKSNEIKLNDIKLEVGNLLSSNSKDYLKNPDDIEESIIKRLKLDTSLVNVNEVGEYNYTITYRKKIYNGTVTITPKALPNISNITLKSLSFEINKELPKDAKSYIVEALPNEVLSAIKLDLSNVDTKIPGNYLYSISYNGKLYTNTITIFEPQVTTEQVLTEEEKES